MHTTTCPRPAALPTISFVFDNDTDHTGTFNIGDRTGLSPMEAIVLLADDHGVTETELWQVLGGSKIAAAAARRLLTVG